MKEVKPVIFEVWVDFNETDYLRFVREIEKLTGIVAYSEGVCD